MVRSTTSPGVRPSVFSFHLASKRFEGNVTWVSRRDAFNQRLAYVNAAGNVILKVDNATTVPPGQRRNSVSHYAESSP